MFRVLISVTALTMLLAPTAHARKGRSRAVPVYTRGGQPNIQAQAAAVVDLSSGEELVLKNADDVRPIASISKLMACLVVLDKKIDLEAATTITDGDRQIAFGGARSRLPVGLTFSNRDLLHAALMASDNRAVPALGRAVGLEPPALVTAMNAKASELGLKNTRFQDPVGLNSNNTSTPRDLVGLLRAAMKNPIITDITQKAHYVAHPVGKPGWTIEYTNTDVIARSGKWEVITGKTGYTDLALYCLAIAVKLSDEHPVAMVFLGAVGKMTRFGDFSRVTQWLTERKWKARASNL
ncbi:MAG TPA: serine hydrolase [Polyangia bacterium]|nr:serine hydrolase [Polyangia bacterium]